MHREDLLIHLTLEDAHEGTAAYARLGGELCWPFLATPVPVADFQFVAVLREPIDAQRYFAGSAPARQINGLGVDSGIGAELILFLFGVLKIQGSYTVFDNQAFLLCKPYIVAADLS